MAVQRVGISGSELHMMDSVQTGKRYRIGVSLPYAYSKSRVTGGPFDDATSRWPVVYLLDANWYSGVVTDMVRWMAWCGGTSDAIVVGIGYPEDDDPQETWREAFARRNYDFTTMRDEVREQEMGEMAKRPIDTGHASAFYQFIRTELIPFVEQTYRADPNQRILAGHSLGGHFVLYALFEAPDVFHTFISGSANPGYEERMAFRCEAAYAQAERRLATRLYLSAGSLESGGDNTTLSNMLEFAKVLESRSYEGFTLVKQVFEDLNHCEVIAPCFQAGLKFALKK